METVIRYFVFGIEVKRSSFAYDEELRRKLEQIERAVMKVRERKGEWIKGIELNLLDGARRQKGFSMAIDEERRELVLMFMEEVGR